MVRADLIGQADDEDRTGNLVFAHSVNRTSANGVTGRRAKRPRKKARQWFDWMVDDLSELIRRGMGETPPLDHSYFTQVTTLS